MPQHHYSSSWPPGGRRLQEVLVAEPMMRRQVSETIDQATGSELGYAPPAHDFFSETKQKEGQGEVPVRVDHTHLLAAGPAN